jgi:hypothetical protein
VPEDSGEDDDEDDNEDANEESDEDDEDANNNDDDNNGSDAYESQDSDDPLSDARDPPVFLFALQPDGKSAKLSRSDMAAALRVLGASKLPNEKIADLATKLGPLLPASGVKPGDFDDAVAKLTGVAALTNTSLADEITAFYSRVHFALSGLGLTSPDAVVCALCIFAAGSKSDKLAFAFKRLSTSEGRLSPCACVACVCSNVRGVLRRRVVPPRTDAVPVLLSRAPVIHVSLHVPSRH